MKYNWVGNLNIPRHSADGYWQVVDEDTGDLIAEVTADGEEGETHASLLGAAPAMLAELKALRDDLVAGRPVGFSEWGNKLNAIIDKAGG